MTCYRDKSVLVLLKHIGIKYCTRESYPEEVESLKAGEYTRRYLVYSLFIEKKMTLDKALSLIVAYDKLLGIADNTISEIVTAFETFFNRKFRIYKPEFTTQLNLFTD